MGKKAAKSSTKRPGPKKITMDPKKEMTSSKIIGTSTDKISSDKKTKKPGSVAGVRTGSKKSEILNSKKTLSNAPGGRRIATQSAKCLLEDIATLTSN